MQVRPIRADDLPAASALLAANDLPTDDLLDTSITLLGAYDEARLLGVIGLQRCDRLGLLRSLAVETGARKRGVGRVLCERVIEIAREQQLEGMWLLTTSAKDYFTRLGFVAVPRNDAPDPIRQTAQFSALCPSSAIVMKREL